MFFNIFANVLKINEIIPLHKYSYPYLGLLKFSSGAFRCKLNGYDFELNGYDLERHVLIKGPTADNVYQSKNQPLGSKEQSVELRNRFASSHTSGEVFRKKCCFIEGSQKHVVSVTLNGRSLKQPGFFLELASWPN